MFGTSTLCRPQCQERWLGDCWCLHKWIILVTWVFWPLSSEFCFMDHRAGAVRQSTWGSQTPWELWGFSALEHSYLVHRSFSALFIEALQTYFWPWIICGMVTELIKHFPGLGICGQRFLKNNLWELKQNKASHLLNEIAWMLESPLRSLPKKRTGGVLNYGCQILWDPEI